MGQASNYLAYSKSSIKLFSLVQEPKFSRHISETESTMKKADFQSNPAKTAAASRALNAIYKVSLSKVCSVLLFSANFRVA